MIKITLELHIEEELGIVTQEQVWDMGLAICESRLKGLDAHVEKIHIEGGK